MKKHINKNNLLTLAGLFVLMATAAIVVFALCQLQFQPSGNDIWSHLYKGDIAYHNLLEGRFYQCYSEYWYNGTQLFRYWAPFSYYSIALLEFISGGDIVMAYRFFAAFSIILGGIPWLLWGRETKRPLFATGIAMLWFFFPENIRVYMCEGNMPRMMTAIVIPYVIYFMWRYLHRDKKYSLIGITISVACMILSHVMITAMLCVAAFVFLVFDSKANKTYKKAIKTLVAMVIGLLLVGFWLVPALSGGIMNMNSDANTNVMEMWMSNIQTLLNPMNRISGVVDTFYYGISMTAIAVAGIFLAKKGKKSGFVLFIMILLMSTTVFFPILSKMPLSTLFWMTRFSTIAYGFFLFSLMDWQSLKKKYAVVVLVILLLDCIPSMNFVRYNTSTTDEVIETANELKSETTYRAAVMDLSRFGSYFSWGLSTGDDAVKSTFGWAWQGATTSSNIVMLNTALEYETYDYMFDRCVELGNDTVLVRKDQIGKKDHTIEDVVKGAQKSGYYLINENRLAYIFKKNTPEQFGVKTTYEGLALGKYANEMTFYYPSFEEADSDYIDDYKVEELSRYKSIFLSGILYHDKKTAEDILKKTAATGTRIVVDVTHVQEDSSTKQLNFLGVTSQSITIQDRYTTFNYSGKKIVAKDFSTDYSEWFTGYIGGTDKVLGTMDYHGQQLIWLGTNESSPNVYFLGLNLMYHAVETDDTAVFDVLDDILGIGRDELPNRKIVPLKMEIGKDQIKISSNEENYNTTLAYQDNFASDSEMWVKNNLLYVKDKNITIDIVYPKKKEGIAVTIFGLLATVGLGIIQFREKKKDRKQQEQTE